MPFFKAELEWEQEQEQNLIYVAITRAEHELIEVTGVRSALDRGLHRMGGSHTGGHGSSMRIEIDQRSAEESGRLIGIRLSHFTLRLIAIWRRYVDDVDQALILAAVTAVTADRLTRIELEPRYRDVRVALPPELRARCNVTSVAEATGLNRETARRKIERLLADGFLARDKDGSIIFAEGLIQEERTRNLIQEQLETARRLVEDLFRDGVLRLG